MSDKKIKRILPVTRVERITTQPRQDVSPISAYTVIAEDSEVSVFFTTSTPPSVTDTVEVTIR